jgi:arabinofuranosyltransferase
MIINMVATLKRIVTCSKKLSIKHLLLVLFLVYVVELFVTAWVCDDGFITAGTAYQFLNGNGLVFNIGDRVQSYTNPLMLFFMIVFQGITGEPYWSTLIINIVSSLIAVWIIAFKLPKKNEDGNLSLQAILPMLILITSISFIFFSTSGLENSLESMLLAIFAMLVFNEKQWTKNRLFLLSLTSSLLLLCRYDILLLVLPALIYIFFFKAKRDGIKIYKSILLGILGAMPFILWEAFSLIYYGFLFPNTAYAKLNSGIPKIEYIARGLAYLFKNTSFDIVAIVAIFLVIILAIIKRNNRLNTMLALGIFIYLIYLIYIGGDFMLGRLLTPLVVLSAIILGQFNIDISKIKPGVFAIAFITFLGALSLGSYLGETGVLLLFPGEKRGGIVLGTWDEAKSFEPKTNLLLNIIKRDLYKTHMIYVNSEKCYGAKVVDCVPQGMSRLALGPKTHIVDEVALTDPLLARIPSINNIEWKTGHLYRYVPDGYIETLITKKNVIQDKDLREYYSYLHNITSGDIFSKKRFENIINMNLGKYNYLIDKDKYRNDYSMPEEGFYRAYD